MNRPLVIAAVVVGAGAAAWFAWELSRPAAETLPALEESSAPPPVVPAAPEGPAVRYPLAEPEAAAPLPSLEQSDPEFNAALARALGTRSLPDYLYPDGLIRRVVATVDNLPRRRVSTSLMPVRPVSGPFAVAGEEGAQVIAPANSVRYRLYVTALEQVDTRALVDLYVRFYPLFQQAYRELGYPRGYFNDRLVDALDDLLEAPQVPGPIAVTRPNVLYQFADPELEALSAGQKMMVRMGPENAARVKLVLRTLRSELVSRTALAPTR